MIITLIGHREVLHMDAVRLWVRRCILELGDPSPVFYLGGYGAFDALCAAVCSGLKGMIPKSELVYVTPYVDRTPNDPQLYDTILYPPLENIPRRFAILQRNFYMIERADIVIAYIRHFYGGAYQAFRLAKRLGKKILQWDNTLIAKEKTDNGY